ncbi:MAG: hypothetical protein ACM3JB_26045 [Acidobacteriaceae bacterium]
MDGKTHNVLNYAARPAFVVVGTCNHCSIAQIWVEVGTVDNSEIMISGSQHS